MIGSMRPGSMAAHLVSMGVCDGNYAGPGCRNEARHSDRCDSLSIDDRRCCTMRLYCLFASRLLHHTRASCCPRLCCSASLCPAIFAMLSSSQVRLFLSYPVFPWTTFPPSSCPQCVSLRVLTFTIRVSKYGGTEGGVVLSGNFSAPISFPHQRIFTPSQGCAF